MQPFLAVVLYSKSTASLILCLAFTLFLQFLTGIPKPDSLQELNADQLWVQISRELFDYPFWLQDLSHLPLFFTYAWLWARYLGPISFKSPLRGSFLLILIVFGYAFINEAMQAFIPERFPSAGDLFMNFAGASLGLCLHWFLSAKTNQKKDF